MAPYPSLKLLVCLVFFTNSWAAAKSLVEEDAQDSPLLVVQDVMEKGLVQDAGHGVHRELNNVPNVPCAGRGSQIYYFNIEVDYTPQGGYDTSGCTADDMQLLGEHTNGVLLQHGVGSGGAGDNAVYVGRVCRDPSNHRRTRRLGDPAAVRGETVASSTSEEEPHHRKLGLGFIYRGGGGCRFCPSDNNDWRMLSEVNEEGQQTAVNNEQGAHTGQRELSFQHDPNWFANIYKPEMQNSIRNSLTAMLGRHQSEHAVCVGQGARVDVTVTQVGTASQADYC